MTRRSNRERWYDIPDYRGLYQVSNRGRVGGLPRFDARGVPRAARVLRCRPRPNGRRYVILCKNGVVCGYCVSVLMARTYGIPNPRRRRYVVHRNHDNSDFRRSNLAWATLAELRLHDGLKYLCPYYGVTCNSRRGGPLRWMAFFRAGKKRFDFGLFATPEEAAYAYDMAVKRMGLKRPLNGLPMPKAWQPRIESLPGEIWRPFPAAPRTHMISNLGRVRTVAYIAPNGNRVTPKLRKVTVSANGCRTIAIRQQRYAIRTMLAKAFRGSEVRS